MKRNSKLAGIIITDLIVFISYLIFPSGIFFFADIQMIIGVLWGTYFALNNLQKKFNFFKNGIIIGLAGACISALSISVFEISILISINQYSIQGLFVILGYFLIEALIVGLLLGLLEGYYFHRKNISIKENDNIDEDFYNNLKDF